MTWTQYSGVDDGWNQAIAQVDTTYLHSGQWSKHLSNLGWECYRWQYQSDEQSAFIQGFLKRYPLGVGVLWFPDWIAGDYATSSGFVDALRHSLSLRWLYVRVRSHHAFNQQDLLDLQQDFTKAKNPFDTALTMHLDLTLSTKALHQGLSKNWRRNLKRSNKLDYEIVEVTEVDKITSLYAEFITIKGVRGLFSEQQITSLMQTYQDQIIVIGAQTRDGKIQSIRGAIIYQNQAIDIFAATNALARKHYLSYALCWDLLMRCKQRNCQHFDFNGVDLDNMGVYNFKKGTGAELVKTLGEFEYASNTVIKHLVNFASRWRHSY